MKGIDGQDDILKKIQDKKREDCQNDILRRLENIGKEMFGENYELIISDEPQKAIIGHRNSLGRIVKSVKTFIDQKTDLCDLREEIFLANGGEYTCKESYIQGNELKHFVVLFRGERYFIDVINNNPINIGSSYLVDKYNNPIRKVHCKSVGMDFFKILQLARNIQNSLKRNSLNKKDEGEENDPWKDLGY